MYVYERNRGSVSKIVQRCERLKDLRFGRQYALLIIVFIFRCYHGNDVLMLYRFETEPDLFYTYRYHRVTGTSEPEPCFGPCLNQELCKMRTIAYDTYQNCTSRTSL